MSLPEKELKKWDTKQKTKEATDQLTLASQAKPPVFDWHFVNIGNK